MQRLRWTLSWVWLFGALLTACAGEDPDAELDLVESEQAIINGQENNDPTAMGAVHVRHGIGPRTTCSGILLRNRVVLTARHCVTTDHSATGTVDRDMTNYAVISVNTAYTVRSASANPNNFDLAILILSQPVALNGSTTAWRMPIYPGTNGSLTNTSVVCGGYGSSTLTTGAGVYRVAQIPVFHATTNNIYLQPNGNGQIPWKGDSGGPCIRAYNGALHIVGIMTNARLNPEQTAVRDATLVGAPAFKAWADSTASRY
jgi:hypothetical protein